MLQEKVGFIGLGTMGKPMAENVLRKGFDTVVYDVRSEPVSALKKLGAKVARSPQEVGELSNIVIIMVRDSTQAEKVILGEKGTLNGVKEGSIIIVMSTVEPSFCEKMAKIAMGKGVGLLDAPVSGGANAAAARTLTIIVGGEEHLVKKCHPVLEAIGNRIFYVGSIGMGQIVKLANNIISHSSYFATTEAIALVTKAGISLERFLEIVRVSSGNTWAAQNQNWHSWWSRKMKVPGGQDSMALVYKDLHLALDISKSLGINPTYLEAIAQLDITKLISNVPSGVSKE